MRHIVIFCNFENFNRILNEGIPNDKYYKTLITEDENMVEKCKDIYSQIFYIEERPSKYKSLSTEKLDKLIDKINDIRSIDGIFSPSELMVDKLARYRDRYNIKYGIKYQDSVCFRNKILMKDIISNNTSVNVPRYRRLYGFKDIEEFINTITPIAVIKPIDGMGTVNTFKVTKENINDVVQYIESDISNYEIEEFIDGDMYHVDTILYDGKPQFTSVGKYLLSTMEWGEFDLNTGYIYPDHNNPLIKNIIDSSNEVLRNMPIKEGVTHMELFVDKFGKIYFCEVAARIAGGGIIFAIEDTCGINVLCQGAQAFAGIEPDFSKLRKQDNGGYAILHKKIGTVIDITSEEKFKELSGVRTATVLYKKGDNIKFSGSSGDVAGIVTWISNSFEENKNILAKISEKWILVTDE